jgi:hypothetical protein
MAECPGSDDSSVIDIDDAPPAAAPPKYRHKRLKPPSARAILEQGDRDFRKPPAAVVKCHILGVAVLHDLLRHFERSQGQPLAPQARRIVEQRFNSAANFVLSTFLPPPPPPTTAHHRFIRLQVTCAATRLTTGQSTPSGAGTSHCSATCARTPHHAPSRATNVAEFNSPCAGATSLPTPKARLRLRTPRNSGNEDTP